MKLFHFTSVSLAEAILSSSISQGHFSHADGTMTRPVVWLTTDPSHQGHGLTTGKELITSGEAKYSERVQGGRLRNTKTLDKTRIRIAVDLDPSTDGSLVSFVDYCGRNETKFYAKVMGISGLYRLQDLTDKQFLQLKKSSKTKETTWWLRWRPILPETFAAVEYNDGGKFVPYSFEKHGRQAMEDIGFTFVSEPAHNELSEIIPAGNRFELPKALVLCAEADTEPQVAIRGAHRTSIYSIESGHCVQDTHDPFSSLLEGWVSRHRDELMECWKLSEEKWVSFQDMLEREKPSQRL